MKSLGLHYWYVKTPQCGYGLGAPTFVRLAYTDSSPIRRRIPNQGIAQTTHNDRNSLFWRHNGHDGISNYQPHDCLLNHLFRSKKTPKLRVTGLYARNSPVTSEFPAQWPVTRKMFPFDDVIMYHDALLTGMVAGGKHHSTSASRLFHAPTRTTSSGCLVLHRTDHALWNLYGDPYRNRAEKEEETVTW